MFTGKRQKHSLHIATQRPHTARVLVFSVSWQEVLIVGDTGGVATPCLGNKQKIGKVRFGFRLCLIPWFWDFSLRRCVALDAKKRNEKNPRQIYEREKNE